jgi:hypothetical protein
MGDLPRTLLCPPPQLLRSACVFVVAAWSAAGLDVPPGKPSGMHRRALGLRAGRLGLGPVLSAPGRLSRAGLGLGARARCSSFVASRNRWRLNGTRASLGPVALAPAERADVLTSPPRVRSSRLRAGTIRPVTFVLFGQAASRMVATQTGVCPARRLRRCSSRSAGDPRQPASYPARAVASGQAISRVSQTLEMSAGRLPFGSCRPTSTRVALLPAMELRWLASPHRRGSVSQAADPRRGRVREPANERRRTTQSIDMQ